MTSLKAIMAAVLVAAIVLPASAGTWVDKSAAWSGLSSDGALVGNGNDLYYFRGTSAKKYDWITDTWAALASSAKQGYILGRDPYTFVSNVNGQFYFYHHNGVNYFEIFDPSAGSTGSWSTVTMPTDDSIDTAGVYTKSWSQGCVYSSYDQKYYTMWTDAVPPESGCYYSVYDPSDGSWTAISTFNYISPGWSWWSNNLTVTVGTKDYRLAGTGGTVSLNWYDLTSSMPADGTTGTTSSHALSSSLVTNELWGCEVLARSGTDIYVAGGGTSGHFLRYDTVLNEWTELESFTATGEGDGSCNHSITVANSYVVVQDGAQFLMYNLVPEPATMALLAVGGLGLLVRNRRRA